MTKILFIGHRASYAGGAEDDLERILKYLHHEEFFQIDLFIPDGPRIKQYNKFVNRIVNYKEGYLSILFPSSIDYLKYFIKGIIQCWQIFVKLKPREYEICFVNVSALIIPAVFIKLISRKTKLVFIVREMIKPDKLRNFIFKLINYVSSGVVFVSEGMRHQFSDVTHQNTNLLTIFSASEPPDFFQNARTQKSVLNFFDEENLNSSFVFLNIGPISPVKNQKLILEALKLLIEKETATNFVFLHIGAFDPEYYYVKEFFEKVNELGIRNQCRFLGVLDKEFTHEYIKKSNAVVISSATEGFPLVISEAFMNKSFLITTNCISNENILKNNFNCLIIQNDPKELKNALLYIKNNPQHKDLMIEQAYKTYEEYMNLEKNLSDLSHFFKKI